MIFRPGADGALNAQFSLHPTYLSQLLPLCLVLGEQIFILGDFYKDFNGNFCISAIHLFLHRQVF